MSLKKMFRIFLAVQFAAALCLAFLVVYLFLTQKELSKSRQVHFQSFLLADELRQSSDDLTRLARTYVATMDEKYEKQYWDVLAIRNGLLPRPVDYNRIYWDFMAENGVKPRPDSTPVSLKQLMINQGITKEEFAKLESSQKYSDELVNTERIAMNAVKGLFVDKAGRFTIKKKPDQAFAIKLMNDSAYHKNKAMIMKPIDDFYVMLNERTGNEVYRDEQKAMNILRVFGVLLFLILGMFLVSFIFIQRQIDKRQNAEEALRIASIYSRNLIEASVDPLVTINAEGKITDVNLAAEKITGIGRDRLIGTVFSNYFTEPEKAHTGYLNAFRNGEVIDYPLTVQNIDGSKKDVVYNASVYRDEKGEVQGVFAAARDITERKKAEHELENYKDHLEELVRIRTENLNSVNQELAVLNRKEKEYHFMLQKALNKEIELSSMKSNIINTVSHEFRTPMTIILSSVELLHRYKHLWSEEKSEEFVNRIRRQVRHLSNLLNDVMVIGKMESGDTYFNPKKINLHNLIKDRISDMQMAYNDSHETVFRYLCASEEYYLDEKLIEFIVGNLLSNAYKFSPGNGKVNISVSDDEGRIKIEVADKGIGIPEEEREIIFQAFGRGSNVETIAGNGLGLTIVKHSVDLFNGRISLVSVPGKGSTFTVLLPIKEYLQNGIV